MAAISDERYSLLTVEDDPEARVLLGRAIAMAFPTITLFAAENGRVGLQLYKEHRPDIVLTDIKMPLMDGIEMAGEILRLDPAAVIALVSAYCDTEQYRGCAEGIGIHHLITKPVDYRVLFDTIRECIGEVTSGRAGSG